MDTLKNLGVWLVEGCLNARKAMVTTGFLLMVIYAIISFILIRPTIFEKFFEEDRTLTLMSGISALLGVLGFVILWAYNLSFQTHLT